MVKIIKTSAPVNTRKRYVPEVPFWKGKTRSQISAYVAKLDVLDKRALKTAKDEKWCN